MAIDKLLSQRLLLVTGKGGTGKTTLASAIGRLASDRGKRVIICEVDTQKPSLTPVFGVLPTYKPVMINRNLAVCNLDWHNALEEWLERTVPGQRVVKLILSNPVVKLFLDATPGAREVVILSKIASLVESWDMVIVDMPASGHAIGMLRVPNLALKLMAAGPIRKRAEEVLALFTRRDTSLVMVALPEEMVVNETVETYQAVRHEVPGLNVAAVVLNRAAAPSLNADERKLLERLSEGGPEGDLEGGARELLVAGVWEAGLEQDTAGAIDRLREEIGVPVLPFPRLGTLGGFDGGAERVVHQFAAALARAEIAERNR